MIRLRVGTIRSTATGRWQVIADGGVIKFECSARGKNLIGMTPGRQSRGNFSGETGCREKRGGGSVIGCDHYLSATSINQPRPRLQAVEDDVDDNVHPLTAATVPLPHSALYTAHGPGAHLLPPKTLRGR
jgi:hypothetical protein